MVQNPGARQTVWHRRPRAQRTSGLTAMWTWRLPDAAAPASVVQVSTDLALRDVYLSVPWTGVDERISETVRRLRVRGVRVWCLGAEPQWALRPADAVAWAGRALAGAPFHGVHLNVEPWTLAEWRTDRPRVVAGFVDLLQRVRAAIGPRPLEFDAATLLAKERHAGRNAFVAALAHADGVVIMAYRNRANGPDGMIAFSSDARAACQSAGRPYRLAVETQPAAVVGDPRLTFHGHGRAVLRCEVALVDERLRADPRYRGIALHDWRHWLALRA